MPRPIVFRRGRCALLPDDVAIALGDPKTAGNAGLLVLAIRSR
jgi:hypothetical protein